MYIKNYPINNKYNMFIRPHRLKTVFYNLVLFDKKEHKKNKKFLKTLDK